MKITLEVESGKIWGWNDVANILKQAANTMAIEKGFEKPMPWRKSAYVSISTQLVVEYRRGAQLTVAYRYPATASGALQAGADLFQNGCESWMNSSSIDWPTDYGAPDLDFRELMEKGWQEAETTRDKKKP